MLNKLLKRCMPWMDKGRWYKIVLEPSSGTYVIGAGTDPAFQNVIVNYAHDTAAGYTAIDLNGSGIYIIDLKIKEFAGNMFAYSNADFHSFANGTTIIFHDPHVINPDHGVSFEILAFGR